MRHPIRYSLGCSVNRVFDSFRAGHRRITSLMTFKNLKFLRLLKVCGLTALAGVGIVVILTGCGALPDKPASGSGTASDTEFSQVVELQDEQAFDGSPLDVILDEGNMESSWITQDGGTLETASLGSRFALTLPANALINEDEIKLTPVSNLSGLPLPSGMLAAVQLGPEGLRLLRPATLTLELPEPVPDDLVGFILQDNGEGFHLYPVDISGNTVTFRLMHFTQVGVASATDGDIETLDTTGLKGKDLAEHRIAVLHNKLQSDPSLDLYDVMDEIKEILFELYIGEGGIWDQLVSVKTVSDLHSAVSEFIGWRIQVELANVQNSTLPWGVDCGLNSLCVVFEDLDTGARNLITTILEDRVTSANNKCLKGDTSQEVVALDFLNYACNLYNLGYISIEFYDQLVDLKTCGIWSLEVIIPETLCFAVGETLNLEVIAYDKDGKPLPGREVMWKNDDENIITVDDNGIVTGVGEGSAWFEVYDKAGGSPCSYSTEVIIDVISLDGVWSATEIANETACDEGVNTYRSNAIISHEGSFVTISGSAGWGSGIKSGCSISGYGGESEDRGVSYGGGSLTISQDGMTMTGGGPWHWHGINPETGEEESCSGSSTFIFTR